MKIFQRSMNATNPSEIKPSSALNKTKLLIIDSLIQAI